MNMNMNMNMEKIFKTGGSSIILGSEYYKGFFPIKINKLLKVTKIENNHNELKNLSLVRQIENYKDFYALPDEDIKIILKDSKFYEKLLKLIKYSEVNIFDGNLQCMYTENAGHMDLLDSLISFIEQNDKFIWGNKNAIIEFTKQVSHGIYFLHKKKICHNDIKPENIMVKKVNNRLIFKIIDFGFASVEPFDDYIIYFRGTPGYFPFHFEKLDYMQNGLPKIYANDMKLIDNKIPMVKNRSLVYKIDSYCFGRVLNLINYYLHYREVINFNCLKCISFKENKKKKFINTIIKLLLNDDCFSRITIIDLVDNYIIPNILKK